MEAKGSTKGFLYKSRKRRRIFTKPAVRLVDHRSSSLKFKKVRVKDDSCSDSEHQDDYDDNGVLVDVDLATSNCHDESRSHSGVETSFANEYRSRQKKAAGSWLSIKSPIVQKIIEMEAVPVSTLKCTHCNQEEAIACCHACGGLALYCVDCIKKLHANVNIAHPLFVWKDEESRFIPLPHIPVIRAPHICCADGTYFKELTCADLA
uniref:Uncharacterized protein n=1 Tax=Amphimedon queenslandica TaxID=400682 RepID=A0A1X7SEY5_AMPQE